MIDANVFSNGGEVRRLPLSRRETLNILQFQGIRTNTLVGSGQKCATALVSPEFPD